MQFGQHRRKSGDRIVGDLGIGDVTLDTVDGENATQRTSAPDAHDIAKICVARGFAEDAPVGRFPTLLQCLHYAQRAVARRTFLVAGDQQCDAAAVLAVRCQKLLDRHDHGGEAAFHVG